MSVLGIDPLLYLSVVLFVPLLGAMIALFAGRAARLVAIATALLELLLGVGLLYDLYGESGFSLGGGIDWLPAFGLRYALQADALNVWLVLLTGLLLLIAVLAPAYNNSPHKEQDSAALHHQPSYYAGLLALATGMLGVFLAHSVFLFYIFWEAMLVPAYFLIARFARERGPAIALRFVLYALGGGLVMLAGLIGLGAAVAASGGGFNPDAWLADVSALQKPALDAGVQSWLFAAIVIGVAVKIPLVPLHSWLPDTYAESPAPVTVLVAGVMSKTAVYVLLRYGVLMFPAAAATWQPWLAGVAIAGILYGAMAALAANSLPRIAAYASLSHMSFIALGVVSANRDGQNGAILQMVNHGLIIAALFLMAAMLERRAGSRNLTAFGGWGKRRPLFATMFMLISLATLGLPGLGSFAGEFLIMLGAWRAQPAYAALAVLGVILAAWYMVRLYQRVMHGAEREHPAADMSGGELALLLPLVLLFIILGLAPGLITGTF